MKIVIENTIYSLFLYFIITNRNDLKNTRYILSSELAEVIENKLFQNIGTVKMMKYNSQKKN